MIKYLEVKNYIIVYQSDRIVIDKSGKSRYTYRNYDIIILSHTVEKEYLLQKNKRFCYFCCIDAIRREKKIMSRWKKHLAYLIAICLLIGYMPMNVVKADGLEAGSYIIFYNDTEYSAKESGNTVGNDEVNSFSDTTTIVFSKKEQEDGSGNLCGVRVFDGTTTSYIRFSEENTSYTFSDTTKSYEIQLIDWMIPFDGEYMLDYDDFWGKVMINSEEKNCGYMDTFTEDTELSFTFTQEPYAVAAFDNENLRVDLITVGNSEHKTACTYTPETNMGFRVMVWWNQESYEYDMFEAGEGNKLIGVRSNGNGNVQIKSSILPENIITRGEQELKVRLPIASTELSFQVQPNDQETLQSIRVDGMELNWSDVVNNNPYSIEIDILDDTYTIRSIPCDHDYIEIEFQFSGGGEENPNLKKVDFDDRGATIRYQLDDGDYQDLPESRRIDITDATSLAIEITGSENCRGIKVWYNDGEDHNSSIKLNAPYTYQFDSIASWNEARIEVIDWDDCIYDYEYRIRSCGPEIGSILVNNQSKELTDGIWSSTFETNGSITIGLTEIVYKVMICPNDEPKTPLIGENGIYEYTPNSNQGFEIQIYPTKEAYDFDMCQPEEEQKMVEYQVRSTDGSDGGMVSYDVTPIQSVTYEGWTRLVLSDSTSCVNLTIEPTNGYEYEVWVEGNNVRETVSNHVYSWDVSRGDQSARPEICFINQNSGPEEPGPEEPSQDPEGPGPGNPVSGKTDFKGAAELIKNGLFGYKGIDETRTKEDIESNLEWELWYDHFGYLQSANHAGSFYGMFDKVTAEITDSIDTYGPSSAFQSAVTLGELQSNGIAGLSYYEYTVDFSDCEGFNKEDQIELYGTDNGMVTGRCYLFDSYTQVVVGFTKGTETTYQIVDASKSVFEETEVYGAYDMEQGEFQDEPKVILFGNGASIVGRASSGASTYRFASHVTQEHSNLWRLRKHEENGNPVLTDKPAISCKLGIINTNIEGFKVEGNALKGTAAAWGWTEWPLYWTNESTTNHPMSFNVYLGNTELTLESLHYDGIPTVESVECTLPYAAKAVNITNEAGVFHIKLLSAYYDNVSLKITYSNGEVGYAMLNLVAIDLKNYWTPGGSTIINIFHGSDQTRQIELGESGSLLSASYYYLSDQRPDQGKPRVNMYVTYTWQDGSITTKKVAPYGELIIDANQGTNPVDDYILWKSGDTATAPIKVEVIAVLPDSEGCFGGAVFGSGAGVSLEIKD